MAWQHQHNGLGTKELQGRIIRLTGRTVFFTYKLLFLWTSASTCCILLLCTQWTGTQHESQSLDCSTWPQKMNEWGNLWPQRDLESIFSSLCRSHPPYTYQEEPACPWRRRCSITMCCSVSHMAEDAVLHYSLSHWEGQDSSSSSQIWEIGCDVRYGLKLTQEKKILMEQDKIKVNLGCVGGSLVWKFEILAVCVVYFCPLIYFGVTFIFCLCCFIKTTC